jgi:hypothetical protein
MLKIATGDDGRPVAPITSGFDADGAQPEDGLVDEGKPSNWPDIVEL